MKENLHIQPFTECILATTSKSCDKLCEQDRYGSAFTEHSNWGGGQIGSEAITESAWSSRMGELLDIKGRAPTPVSLAPEKTS